MFSSTPPPPAPDTLPCPPPDADRDTPVDLLAPFEAFLDFDLSDERLDE